jgi:hypothetical protein
MQKGLKNLRWHLAHNKINSTFAVQFLKNNH